MMKRDFRDKWVADLRSGNYEQATGVLCELKNDNPNDTSCRCCLGVAMNPLGIKPNVFELWKEFGYDSYEEYTQSEGMNTLYAVHFEDSSELPNDDQINLMGLTLDQIHILTEMNDGNPGCGEPRKSFDEIADYIMTLPVED